MAINKTDGATNLGNFNFAKGMGIILVILTHTFAHLDIKESTILYAIELLVGCTKSGLMPMFFLISGFGIKLKSPPKNLKKTFSEFIIPYILVLAAYATIYPLAYYRPAYGGEIIPTINGTLQYVFAFLLGIGASGTEILGYKLAWCTAAWFLLSLFIALNISNIILRIENIPIQIGCVLACLIAADVLFKCGVFLFCIPQGLMAVGYCCVGYFFKKYGLLDKISQHRWISFFLTLIFIAETIWGYFDLRQGIFRLFILDYFGALCSGVLFLKIFVRVGRAKCKLIDIISQIGIYTYWILAMHSVEMEAFPWWYWQMHWVNNIYFKLIVELIIKTLVFIFGCIIIKKIIKRKYIRRSKKKTEVAV